MFTGKRPMEQANSRIIGHAEMSNEDPRKGFFDITWNYKIRIGTQLGCRSSERLFCLGVAGQPRRLNA